jgi:hypothetical protein
MPSLGMETGTGHPNIGVEFAKLAEETAMRLSRTTRTLAIAATVALVGTVSYAFLGSISGLGTAGHAGAATQTVSGYAVSDIAYTYGADPNDIDNVEFTLDNDANVVHAQLVSGGAWYTCTLNGAATTAAQGVLGHETDTVWDCDTTAGTQATVAAQDQLRIVAHS